MELATDWVLTLVAFAAILGILVAIFSAIAKGAEVASKGVDVITNKISKINEKSK